MTTFNALSKIKPVMVEQINDNVFRVHRTDLRNNSEEVFDQIHRILNDHHSLIIISGRHMAHLNGSGHFVDEIENDYRSHYLVVVHKHVENQVMYNHHQFSVIINRYNKLVSVCEPEHQIELLTVPKVCNEVLRAYSAQYGVGVDLKTGICHTST